MPALSFKTNINCENCIRAVTPQLNKVAGEGHWHVDTAHPQKILTVDKEGLDASGVLKAVAKAGFRADEIGDPAE